MREPVRLCCLTRMRGGWGLQRVGPEEERTMGGAEGGVGGQVFSRGEQVLGN